MGNFIDLTGQRFCRLTVLRRAANHIQKNGQQKTTWLCVCDCGNEVVVQGANLKNGHVKSCGCYQKDFPSHTIHGKSKEYGYKTWKHIRQRCYDKNCPAYPRYGGRGIKMCAQWFESFETFHNDVSQLPNFGMDGFSLDRINNDGDYEPGNVRWANAETQGNNKRNNRVLKFNGEEKTLAQWSRDLNVDYGKLHNRLYALHWSVEKTLSTP